MLTKEDFASDQVVKWCPGCGDHAILKAVQDIFPKLGKKKEDIVVVSGIGCSSRFPYYMNTYGFHSIHGRAAAAATGVKLANPNLSVWMITGDGDCTAIGGNHFIHACRRNIDINLILFNNRIYGMTKGQFSPCTFRGTKTKTSPQGTYEDPFNPGELAIGAKATFFARGVDINPKELSEIFMESYKHDGIAVTEVLQNCMIFSNGVH
ncbi:MAG: 2-oxoacid:ferredoxin oxidoreductase subunit beta, partial [Bacteroidales bacterium]|nr:2-oxoacid:ferredoxin oxidoreductase subunit beta [Bacteroidales bacterium]